MGIAALVILATYVQVHQFIQMQQGTDVAWYSYTVLNAYSHDTSAFTQGLVYENGLLYEGTGLYGQSTLRCVQLDTGKVLRSISLPNDTFGEGITILGDRIIQLTWLGHKGFVYHKDSFQLLGEFSYTTEGWGLTNNGTHLIMSDGTANLYFLDPASFVVVGQVEVRDRGKVTGLNELEYIKGEVYANIWKEDLIVKINPGTGRVTGWIDLHGILGSSESDPENVLNGIAYDPDKDIMYVTGKRWPKLFEIRLLEIKDSS